MGKTKTRGYSATNGEMEKLAEFIPEFQALLLE